MLSIPFIYCVLSISLMITVVQLFSNFTLEVDVVGITMKVSFDSTYKSSMIATSIHCVVPLLIPAVKSNSLDTPQKSEPSLAAEQVKYNNYSQRVICCTVFIIITIQLIMNLTTLEWTLSMMLVPCIQDVVIYDDLIIIIIIMKLYCDNDDIEFNCSHRKEPAVVHTYLCHYLWLMSQIVIPIPRNSTMKNNNVSTHGNQLGNIELHNVSYYWKLACFQHLGNVRARHVSLAGNSSKYTTFLEQKQSKYTTFLEQKQSKYTMFLEQKQSKYIMFLEYYRN